jgi:hypothetical protein
MKLQPVGSILFLCSLLLAGCEDSVVEALVVPVATLSAPTLGAGLIAISQSESAEMTLSFTQTVSNTLVAATGTSSAPPTGLTVSTAGGVTCSSIATTAVTTDGATVTVSGCSGNGSVTVRASAGVATSATERTNSSSNSRTVTVDNVKPTVVSMTIASAYAQTNAALNTVTLTFSKQIQDLSATNADNAFSITTGCSTAPAVAVSMSLNGSNQSVATISLSGGVCVDTNAVSVGFNLSKATDLAGNDGLIAGSPANVVYTVDSLAPAAALAAASYSAPGGPADQSSTVTFTLTYTDAVSTTLVVGSGARTTGSTPGLTFSTVSGSADCAVAITSATASGAVIQLSDCIGTATLGITVDAATATGASGLSSTVSNTRTWDIVP